MSLATLFASIIQVLIEYFLENKAAFENYLFLVNRSRASHDSPGQSLETQTLKTLESYLNHVFNSHSNKTYTYSQRVMARIDTSLSPLCATQA